MKDELDIVKWWVVVGIAALTFHKLAKVAINIWGAPDFVKGIVD